MNELDFSTSRAVLVGTGRYSDPDLVAVPAAYHSLARMHGLLVGPLCGWPAESVTVLRDQVEPGPLPDQLVQLFGSATQVALFYYVGHGQVDDEDQLCLGLVDSRTAAHRRATTSLVFGAVRSALNKSRATTKIVILDCCYSGIATRPDGSLADREISALVRVQGAFTMTASGAYNTAWFEPEDAGTPVPQTYFTKALINVIERGIPSEPRLLRLDPIFLTVADELDRQGKPAPTKRSSDFADRFVFARNAAPRHTPQEHPGELAALHERLTALEAQLAARARGAAPESAAPAPENTAPAPENTGHHGRWDRHRVVVPPYDAALALRYGAGVLHLPFRAIRLTVDDRTGYSLASTDEHDADEGGVAFLIEDGKLLLFEGGPGAALRYASRSDRHMLHDSPLFPQYAIAMAREDIRLGAVDRYDLDLVPVIFATGQVPAFAPELVRVRNLVDALASCLDMVEAEELLQRGSPIDLCDDVLRDAEGFLGRRRAKQRLGRMDLRVVAHRWEQLLALVAQQVAWRD